MERALTAALTCTDQPFRDPDVLPPPSKLSTVVVPSLPDSYDMAAIEPVTGPALPDMGAWVLGPVGKGRKIKTRCMLSFSML